MNISELARILKVNPQDLREKLPELGFDIGLKAIKVDNSIANKIIRVWPKYMRQREFRRIQDEKSGRIEKIDGEEEVKKEISLPTMITVREFATKTGKSVNVILTELMKNGIFASLNEKIDFDTASIVADYLGMTALPESEDQIQTADSSGTSLKKILEKEAEADMAQRPPIIVVMGHVDHGKTKLLDAIRRTDIVAGEAGGITQHIGAYQVTRRDKVMTFIDTPGHEAFTAMRSRGAKVADIAILVVAADDGVKEQTVEAFRIIEAAKIPFVVAINKIDKPEANVEKTKQELANKLNITPEDWGGKTICAPVSARDNQGIENLLDMVLLVADMESAGMKANPLSPAVGTVVESRISKGEGPVATILVQNGTLRVGDPLSLDIYACGKVRALKNYLGEEIKEAGPSTPAKIIGLKFAPEVGDVITVGEGEKIKIKSMKAGQPTLAASSAEGKKEEDKGGKKINVIIKSDVFGSAEAIEQSLLKIGTEEARVNILSKSLGNISEGDIKRAETSGALVLGFNVKTASAIEEMARDKGVEIKSYDIIYDLINDIKELFDKLVEPEHRRKDLGKMSVKAIFRTENKSQIVGGVIIEGVAESDSLVEVYRNGQLIEQGKMLNLQSGREDVTIVDTGQEAGIQFAGNPIIEVGDELLFYKDEIMAKAKK